MEEAINNVDPRKKVEVGGFRIDDTGSMVSKSVQLKRSEIYLTELMESICKFELKKKNMKILFSLKKPSQLSYQSYILQCY